MTHVRPVVAQDLIFTAVFEKLQATPYPQNKLELRFANHCPISSLFGEIGLLVVYETNFATDIDSVNPISHITTQNIASFNIS